jgi:hypothetical protein
MPSRRASRAGRFALRLFRVLCLPLLPVEARPVAAVPFYTLRKLHFALRPFFEKIDWQPTTYSRLLKLWIIDNKVPHKNWSLEDGLVG